MFGALVLRLRRKHFPSWKISYGALSEYPVEKAAALESLQVILWSLLLAAKTCSYSLSMEIFVVFPDFRGSLFHLHLSKILLVQVLLFTWWTWHSSPMLSFVCPGEIPGWPVLCMSSFNIAWLSSFSVTTGSLDQSTCHKGEESCFTFQLMSPAPNPSVTCHVSPCLFTALFRTTPTSLATSFLCLVPVLA